MVGRFRQRLELLGTTAQVENLRDCLICGKFWEWSSFGELLSGKVAMQDENDSRIKQAFSWKRSRGPGNP
eukprot:4762502-Amphidinium_carterae.1